MAPSRRSTFEYLTELWGQLETGRAFDVFGWGQVLVNKYGGDKVVDAFETCVARQTKEGVLEKRNMEAYITGVLEGRPLVSRSSQSRMSAEIERAKALRRAKVEQATRAKEAHRG